MRKPLHEIATEVAERHRLRVSALMTPSRRVEIVEARHEAFHLAHKEGHAYTSIGRFFGRNHSTVINAVQKRNGIR